MGMSLSRRSVLALLAAGVASRAFAANEAALSHLLLIVGTPAGAASDVVARAFADAAKLVQPGLAIDIENQGGSGGKLAFEAILEAAGNPEKIGLLQGSLLYYALGGEPQVADQLSSLTLLGAIGVDRRALFVSTKTNIQSFAELLASPTQLIAPTTSAAGAGFIDTLLVNALTGAKLQAVAGYSSAERKLALLNGEANAVVGSIDTFGELVEQGVLKPVLRLNDAGPDAPYADLPLLASVATSPDAPLLVPVIEAVALASSLIAAPPGLAEADIAALTALFDAVAPRLDAGKDDPRLQPTGRAAVLASFGKVLEQRAAIGAAFTRAQICGQSLSDGKACS